MSFKNMLIFNTRSQAEKKKFPIIARQQMILDFRNHDLKNLTIIQYYLE